MAAAGPAAERVWDDDGTVRGVRLEHRPADGGYRTYRGTVRVCTGLSRLRQFVADPSRLQEWIPYTREARALPSTGNVVVYYLRTIAPWPFKDRDMVYRIAPLPPDGSGTLRIGLTGVPGAIPEQRGAVRLAAADGLWTLALEDDAVAVTLRLTIDARPAPAFLANRRLAATVSGMLANLAARFPCAS